jgi:hypothetical protein
MSRAIRAAHPGLCAPSLAPRLGAVDGRWHIGSMDGAGSTA